MCWRNWTINYQGRYVKRQIKRSAWKNKLRKRREREQEKLTLRELNETKGNLLSHWVINVPQRIEGNENSVFYNYVYGTHPTKTNRGNTNKKNLPMLSVKWNPYPCHIVPRGGKKWFFMFLKTSWNMNFWKLHRFVGFVKKNYCNIFVHFDFMFF